MTRKELQEKYNIFGENKDIIPFDCSLKEQICDVKHPNRRYKVRTKEGCPVTIVKWDTIGLFPIHGRFLDGEIETWTEDGYYDIVPFANDYDLVLVDTQPTQSLELNEFENRLCEILDYAMKHPSSDKEIIKSVKMLSPELIDLANKTIKEK